MSKYGVISAPYFPVFGLNTEIYGGNLHIQSEYRKIRTRNNSAFGQFSRSDEYWDLPPFALIAFVLRISSTLKFCPCHCVKNVRIRSFSGPYSVRMREIRTRKTTNTGTFYAVCNAIPSSSFSNSCWTKYRRPIQNPVKHLRWDVLRNS